MKEMIKMHLLEFERTFGKQLRDDQSRDKQEMQTTVTNALQPVLTASTTNAQTLGTLSTQMQVMKARMYVLTTVGLPVGAFLGFLAGKFI